jgi:hypothetical protein
MPSLHCRHEGCSMASVSLSVDGLGVAIDCAGLTHDHTTHSPSPHTPAPTPHPTRYTPAPAAPSSGLNSSCGSTSALTDSHTEPGWRVDASYSRSTRVTQRRA